MVASPIGRGLGAGCAETDATPEGHAVDFDADGNVIGLIIINLRFLLERDGELISVDSRPSDALALALRLDCPIYVEETVLKSSKQATAVSVVNRR